MTWSIQTENLPSELAITLPSGAMITGRKVLFCRAFLPDCNSSEASRAVGVTQGRGAQYLKMPEVKEYLNVLAREHFEIADVNIEVALRELYRVATVSLRDLFLDDGTPIPLHRLPMSVAAAVREYDLEVEHTIDEEGHEVVRRKAKVKFHDKIAAVDRLARYLGMFDESGEPTIPVEFIMERDA